MTTFNDATDQLERIHDLEEEVRFWRARAEEFQESALLLAEEASKCLVLAYEGHRDAGKALGLPE